MRTLICKQQTDCFDGFTVRCVLGEEVVTISEQLVKAIYTVEELM